MNLCVSRLSGLSLPSMVRTQMRVSPLKSSRTRGKDSDGKCCVYDCIVALGWDGL